MEVSVRRMSDPSLGKRRSSNPLVGAAQQLMIPLGEGELEPEIPVPSAGLNSKTECERSLQAYLIL